MSFRLGTYVEGEEKHLLQNGKLKSPQSCGGCDCENPCDYAEFATLDGVQGKAYDLELDEVFAVNLKNNQIIPIVK